VRLVSRVVVLIDGEHYPPVVRAALDEIRASHEVVGAVFAGGTEKVGETAEHYGVPVVCRPDAAVALAEAIEEHAPDVVMDLSDEPVVTSADRFRLASVALARGVSYIGADFQFDPVAAEAETVTPTLAIVGTGKRVGKTAVSAHVARLLQGRGIRPVVLAMGRGGPPAPELLRGDEIALTTEDLLGFARRGLHASSDNYEDALMSRVATVGCRRCGGGLAGSTFFSNVPEGAALADTLGADVLVLEGSGSAVPPVVADASLLVVGAARGVGYVTDYFGPLRLASADAVVIAGAEPALVSEEEVARVLDAVVAARPDSPVSVVTFRPRPISPVAGRRVFFATTAPAALLPVLTRYLEEHHGCVVVGSSPHLSDRARLRADLEAAGGRFDTLLTELKAAAIDVVAMAGERLGVETVLCDNVPVTIGGDDLDETALRLARRAIERGNERSSHAR
jgi:cyclic 2,3-diphosphoglycerate synthetase